MLQPEQTYGVDRFACLPLFTSGDINPSVTFGLLIAKRITPYRAFFYILAQFVGAIIGEALANSIRYAAPVVNNRSEDFTYRAMHVFHIQTLRMRLSHKYYFKRRNIIGIIYLSFYLLLLDTAHHCLLRWKEVSTGCLTSPLAKQSLLRFAVTLSLQNSMHVLCLPFFMHAYLLSGNLSEAVMETKTKLARPSLMHSQNHISYNRYNFHRPCCAFCQGQDASNDVSIDKGDPFTLLSPLNQ